MDLALTRILFTQNMAAMLAFYRDVLGLALLIDEPGFKEFTPAPAASALHNGRSRVGVRPPKLVFWSADVATAREILSARGARLEKVIVGSGLTRCEGKDPDGNPYQISNRGYSGAQQ